jgi:hypothetical protein
MGATQRAGGGGCVTDGVRHLGYFHTEAEAGIAYVQAAQAFRGEFANDG